MFALSYIYIHDIAFISIRYSTPCSIEHSYDYRSMPEYYRVGVRAIETIIELLSVPSITLAERLFGQSDICWNYVVYVPLFVAPQWFIYGLLFERWRTGRAKRVDTKS